MEWWWVFKYPARKWIIFSIVWKCSYTDSDVLSSYLYKPSTLTNCNLIDDKLLSYWLDLLFENCCFFYVVYLRKNSNGPKWLPWGNPVQKMGKWCWVICVHSVCDEYNAIKTKHPFPELHELIWYKVHIKS